MRTARLCRGGHRPACLLLGLFVAACMAPGRVQGDVPALAHRLQGEGNGRTAVRVRPFPHAAELGLAPGQAVVVGGQGWRLPELPNGSAALPQLRAHIERGGRVLLLGYAMALAHPLGLEPRAPDLRGPFRWGFDERAGSGTAQLGFEASSGRCPELVETLQPMAERPHGYWLVGGAPLCAPLCAWKTTSPQHGEVLGRLLQQRDALTTADGEAVFVRWTLGRGEVLGLGLEPGVGDANTAPLLHGLRTWLGQGAAPAHLDYWLLDDPTPVAAARVGDDGEVPGAGCLAHWGVLAAVHDGVASKTPEQVRDEVLLPAFAAGADTLALDLVDRQQGLPLPWAEHDPLARPKDYPGSAWARGWDGASMAQLVQEAHARGVQVQVLLDALPLGDGLAARLALVRYVARQWCDRRRLGAGAVDGLALRDWPADTRGLALAMLQEFQPGGHLLRCGERTGVIGGAPGALDAHDGRPSGVHAFGIAAGHRAGFPGDLFPVGYLDATAQRPVHATAVGGGSFGDWIALQAADFVRERRGGGGAMLWRTEPPTARVDDPLAYVHGVSAEPLVAAVAARCTSTGSDGWRAAQRALLATPPSGFGGELPAPAATVMLANNHFRLCGSGGVLVFDPTGAADFSAPSAQVLANGFCRTRFFGGRPDADELRTVQLDLLGNGRRGEGGHAAALRIVTGGAVPAMLAFAAAPRWPQRIDLAIDGPVGRYELRLAALAVQGQGVLAVGVDEDWLLMLPFADGRLSIQRALPVQLARAGHRHLRLEVVDGGAVALQRLELVRAVDVAAEAVVAVPAGPLAVVREHSASTYHEETVELGTVADWPALWLRSQCDRAVRGLQQERRFGLQRHGSLRASTAGESERELRRPFVLAADSPGLPDLAVLPLRLSRYEHFRLEQGELVLRNQPEAGTSSHIGFAFVPRGEGAAALAHLMRVFADRQRPTVLALGDQGLAEVSADLPIAWSRVLALREPPTTPFLVRENGWWTWRGAVRAQGGGALLRIHHRPGDTVQIVGHQSLLARTRPGPGSLHTVALREIAAHGATVRVLQRSPLAPPAVVMGAAFDTVTIDGKPWSWFDGRTVWLPPSPGTYVLATKMRGEPPQPHVIACGAPLRHCAFDAAANELVFVAEVTAGRPAELPCTAVLAGPRPIAVDGGELVDEQSLRHADAEARALAERGGVLIRFRPGLVRVRYDQ